MCLGIPAKILRIDGDFAEANINGATIKVGVQLLDRVQINDYVLIHTGYALEKLSEEDALETIKTLQELEQFNKESILPEE